MKTLLALITLTTLASCASTRPPIWKDKYGIIHTEEVTTNQISQVQVGDYNSIPMGCRRLRNIYLEGSHYQDWQLKREAAKMGGTHVTKEYVNNLNDTMGVAFDCTNYKAVSRSIQRDRQYIKQKAMAELERRRANKGQPVKAVKVGKGSFNPVNGIPLMEYEGDK